MQVRTMTSNLSTNYPHHAGTLKYLDFFSKRDPDIYLFIYLFIYLLSICMYLFHITRFVMYSNLVIFFPREILKFIYLSSICIPVLLFC